ncbi:hypothetical protein [Synechococcus sp. NOUM97013]|uniref:hypothetical protein n=1 Tax=Synechococcus sp. NOUM97013 TaxID=1442555 RepID=UPI00164433D8|nr:hypothetical protein [Synechococcus sp. NOUM97013]QNI74823.1 putative conserved secreted protein [Synechococcus sp. NOUM97013]
MSRFQSVNAVAALLMSALVVPMICASSGEAAPRSTFPGRRIGGGTRGECAARPMVHLVPSSNVFSLGNANLIALLEGPAANPMPLEVILRPASDDGFAAQDVSPLLQQSLGASVNRLVLLRVPAASSPLLWESSYQCDEDDGADEFGFVTASAPPALTLLLPEADSQVGLLQQQLASLQAVCGSSTAVAPLKQVFDFGDEVIDDSWPETVTVQCF